MIDIDERSSIGGSVRKKIDFIEEFIEDMVNSFSEVISSQGLIDDLKSIMYDAYDKSIYLFDDIELDVDSKSEEMAQHTLCEDGYTDPDNG